MFEVGDLLNECDLYFVGIGEQDLSTNVFILASGILLAAFGVERKVSVENGLDYGSHNGNFVTVQFRQNCRYDGIAINVHTMVTLPLTARNQMDHLSIHHPKANE